MRAVIKPKPLQAPVRGGFTVDDFRVDEQQGTVTCRPGTPWRLAGPGSPPWRLVPGLPAAGPGAPPARPAASSSCTSGMTCFRAARADWAASSGLRHDYMTHRPNVERAIAQVATWRGFWFSDSATAGTARNNAWLKRRTAALNLRNLIGKGLTRRDGAWALGA